MKQALRAEWTKLRTQPGILWLLVGAIVVTVASSAAVSAAVQHSPESTLDVVRVSLSGVIVGQVMFAGLAVLAVGPEYATGMIRTTFAAMPRRSIVLAAKATVVSGLTLCASIVSIAGSLGAAKLILPANGFTSARGYPSLSLADGPTLRAAAGSGLYLVLIALLSLGAAAAVREPATAIASVLGLLYLFPVIAALVTDPSWQERLEQIGPMRAGLAIQATIDLNDLPIAPWKGIAVLAAWATATLFAGALLMQSRDA